jgi:hypothetical protein
MQPSRYAILIGNGTFLATEPSLPPLRCPVKDIKALDALLSSLDHGGYQVLEMPDIGHTAARRAVYATLKKAAPGDFVLVYYSGHGKLDEQGNLYLATSDTEAEALPPTSISVSDIKNYISESAAATVIVILDCCFSGSIKKLFKGPVADQVNQAAKSFEGAGILYLSAATDTQLAEEKETDDLSLLTKHIVDGIAQGGADRDGDGKVSFQELCSYVQTMVPKEGAQKPKGWFLEVEGQVTVALTGKPAYEAQRGQIERKLYELASQGLISSRVISSVLTLMNQPESDAYPENLRVRAIVQMLEPLLETRGSFLEKAIELSNRAQAHTETPAVKVPPAASSQPSAKEQQRLRKILQDETNPSRFLRPAYVIVAILIAASAIGLTVYLRRGKNPNAASNILSVTQQRPINGHTWPFKLLQEGPPENWGIHYEIDGTYTISGDHVAVKITSGSIKLGNNTSSEVKLRALHLGLCSASPTGQWDIYPHDFIPNTGFDFAYAVVSTDSQYNFQPAELQLPLPPGQDPSDLWLCGFLWSNVGGSFPSHQQFRNTLKR